MRPAEEIEITPEMIEAGEDRLSTLRAAGVASTYLVSEIFQAMWAARPSIPQIYVSEFGDVAYSRPLGSNTGTFTNLRTGAERSEADVIAEWESAGSPMPDEYYLEEPADA